MDQITSLQSESKIKFAPGKNKAIVCAVLGASLVAAIEDRLKQRNDEEKIIESLESLVYSYQKTVSGLEEECCSLRAALEAYSMINTTGSLTQSQPGLEEKGI